MSGYKYPTLSCTIPLYNSLIDHVKDTIDKNNINDNIDDNDDNTDDNDIKNIMKEAANKCKNKLLEYYNKTNDTYLIVTILDPRLKMEYFIDNDWDSELITQIKQR